MKLKLSILIVAIAALIIALAVNVVVAKKELNELNSQYKSNISEIQTQITDLKESNTKLSNDNKQLREEVKSQKEEMELNSELIEKLRNDRKQLLQELKSKEKKIEKLSQKKRQVLVSRGSDKVAKTVMMKATAYTAYCTGCTGITYWGGYNLKKNPNAKVIAVDPNVIPLGTKVWVEGYGYAIAADIGGAIKGNKIDVFIPTKSEAYKWGVRTVAVKILKK